MSQVRCARGAPAPGGAAGAAKAWGGAEARGRASAPVGGPLPGEPYPAEEVTRGASFSGAVQLGDELEQCLLGLNNTAPAFGADDLPPELPADPLLRLGTTALVLTASSAPALGNLLLAFLREEVQASALKLSRGKFTLKADVVHSGAMCTVKLRVYDAGDGRHVVEAQRRQGDCVAYVEVFRALTRYLAQHCQLAEGALPPATTPAPPASWTGCAAMEPQDLDPLLYLAEKAASVPETLRAELASAFAGAAKEGGSAGLLLSPRALAALGALLRAAGQLAAGLAAEAVRLLVQRPEAAALLDPSGAVRSALGARLATSAGEAVQALLAEALGAAAARCAVALPEASRHRARPGCS